VLIPFPWSLLKMKNNLKTIILGGGCFWCTEAVFLMMNGIKTVLPGYAGGEKENPTYEEVCQGNTGHAEVVKLDYDPSIVSLEKILKIFFKMHNPTSLNKQGRDVGTQYRSIILYSDEDQARPIKDYVGRIQKEYTSPIVTEVKKLEKFYEAEEYHHRYFERNPNQAYCQVVIAPKVKKVQKNFSEELKK